MNKRQKAGKRCSCFFVVLRFGILRYYSIVSYHIYDTLFDVSYTTDSQDLIIQEHGAVIGGIKNATPSSALEAWLDQDFPVVPNIEWPDVYTTLDCYYLDASFASWVNGAINDDQFYADLEKYQQQGADTYITQLGIDTTNW